MTPSAPNRRRLPSLPLIAPILLIPGYSFAAAGNAVDFTGQWFGIVSLLIFVGAYSLVIAEETLHLRKSKPVMVADNLTTALLMASVAMAVGRGHLSVMSNLLYGELGPRWANILVGVLSAIMDNIPVMFAVLAMNPEMSHD